MSDIEVINVAAWLALLVIGLWLMFYPIGAAQDTGRQASERREPVFHGDSRTSPLRTASGAPQVNRERLAAFRPAGNDRDNDTPPGSPGNERNNRSVGGPEKTDDVLPTGANRQVDRDALYTTIQNAAPGSEKPETEDVKSDTIGSQAAQIDTAESEAKKQVGYSASADSSHAVTSVSTDDAVSAAIPESNKPRSILDQGAVADAIGRQTPLGSLVGECELLASFFLRKHITGDAIPENTPDATPGELQASSCFENLHHRYSVTISDVLKNVEAESAKRYIETRRFPRNYVVEFFDEALVIVISRGSGRPEMLAISPLNPDYEEFFGALVLSSRMTELFVAVKAEPEGELRLYKELDAVLAHFRFVDRG